MLSRIDVSIIFLYLLSTLCIGLKFSRNNSNIHAYSIADRTYSSHTLITSFLATSFGAGSIIGDAAKIFQDGVIFSIMTCGFLIFCFYMSFYADTYFRTYLLDKEFLSVGDLMSYLYNERIAKVTSILGCIVGTLAIAGQLIALGHMMEQLPEIGYNTGVLVVGVVVIFYTTSGGIRSVIATDVVQFYIILLVMPSLVFVIFNQFDGVQDFLSSVDNSKWMILHHPKRIEYFLLFVFGSMPFLWLYPAVLHRFLLVKDAKQIDKMYWYQLLMRVLFLVIVTIIGLGGSVLFPEVSSSNIMPQIVGGLLPSGLKGLFVIAVLAATMSTADSHLNVSAVLVIYNVLMRNRNNNDVAKIFLIKIGSIIIGVFAVIIALIDFDIIELMLVTFALWGSIVVTSIIFAISCNFRCEIAFWGAFVFSPIGYLLAWRYMEFAKGLFPPIAAIISGILGYLFGLLINCLMRNICIKNYKM